MKKRQLATNLAKMPILPMIKIDEKSIIHVWDSVMKKNQVKYKKNVIQKYMERMRRRSYKALLTALETSPALFLMAVGDCIVNKKSQTEVAMKYNIPRSRIQRAMSGKKEHQKGGKQYQRGEEKKTIRRRLHWKSEESEETKESLKG